MKNSKLKICCLSALMLLGGCESSKHCEKCNKDCCKNVRKHEHCKKCEGCEKCKDKNVLKQENKNDTKIDNKGIAKLECVNACFSKSIE